MSRQVELIVRNLLTCSCAFTLCVCLTAGFTTDVLYGQVPQAGQPAEEKLSVFRVKYASDSSLYIDAGRNANLQEGMKLSLINPPPDGGLSDGVRFRGYEHIAELKVISVADSSSICEIVSASGEVKAGQLAFLTPDSVTERREKVEATDEEKYPIILTFTHGDPLEEEVRTVQERKQLQESPVGRVRGRIGFDYGGIHEAGGLNSKQLGLVIQSDISNIGGTYWNFRGYWRGNMNVSSSSPPGANTTTLTDLLNRTYQIGLFYQSPYSPVTIGVGRLFLPWAPSLSTIDGGYLGRKITRLATVGF